MKKERPDPRRPFPTSVAMRPIVTSTVLLVAAIVTSVVGGPPALLVAAHLTLSAAAGLAVGMLAVLTACVVRSVAPRHRSRERVVPSRLRTTEIASGIRPRLANNCARAGDRDLKHG